MTEQRRCAWCNTKNPKYVEYHDAEWGKPDFSDKHLYEMLILESFQAGLSWECVLNKREAFRRAYCGFDIDFVCHFSDDKISKLKEDKGIIRNKRKIDASIKNSKIFKAILLEYGSFYIRWCGTRFWISLWNSPGMRAIPFWYPPISSAIWKSCATMWRFCTGES